MAKREAKDPKQQVHEQHSKVQHSEAASSSVVSLPERFLDPETILPSLSEPLRREFENRFEAIEQERKEAVAKILAEKKQQRMKRLGSQALRKITTPSAKQSPPNLEPLLLLNHKDHSLPASTRNTEKALSATLSKEAIIPCAPCSMENQLKISGPADGDDMDIPVGDGDEKVCRSN